MLDIIDRHPSHGLIWLMIAILAGFLFVIPIIASSFDRDHDQRIKALESGCALDVEVQDLKKRIEALEADGKR